MAWNDSTNSILKACTSTFGESCLYSPRTGDEFTLNGIFSKAFVEVNTGSVVPTQSVKPILGLNLSDFPSGILPKVKDQVTVRGIVYVVIEVQDDGGGGTTLVLNTT